ncbi:MAG: electron transfer flavoprotein subunit alpha, partial [Actinomycetota bacterium]|nr:electron transfer flavoprotein subunit alpha [Actinomycetota bacterium]
MNVAVLVKWVPEPQGTPALGEDHLLVREGANGALDPGDEYGLERALQLVERDGGDVVAVSMGPEVANAAVQRALAMGASRGVHVTDPSLRGADTLVTARVLAAVIRSLGSIDLVVAAVESTDGYTGTLPITIAELLGLPSVTFATALDVVEGELRA